MRLSRHPARPLVLALVGALALLACGGNDEDDASATTTTATTGTASYTPGADPDADAAAQVYTMVFDSETAFDTKAPYLADADALRSTVDAYGAADDQVGHITLVPVDVVVTGDTAAITYTLLFAGVSPGYPPQDGTIERVGGTWTVSRDEFCAFMALARVGCPA